MKYILKNCETTHLTFREISVDDSPDWLAFFRDPASFQYWKGDFQSPEVECKNWYQKQFDRYVTNRGGMNALIEKSSGKLVGHAGLLLQTVDGVPELEVAYSLLGAFRGKGFATEAAARCISFAFENKLCESIISIISLTNVSSAQVAKKNGMHIDKNTFYSGNEVNIFRRAK